MAQKKNQGSKATAGTASKKPPATKKYPPPTQAKAPPPPPPPKVTEVTEMGLYPIKAVIGGLNIKGVPLPGKRVMLIMPNTSKVVDNLTIIKTGDIYSLK